jgi:hypothetical protein
MPVCPIVCVDLPALPASHIDKRQPAFRLDLSTDFHNHIFYTSYALPGRGCAPRQDDYNQTLEADRFAAVQLKPLYF